MLVFGGISSPGIYDDPAKVIVALVCIMAGFPRELVQQHLDDMMVVSKGLIELIMKSVRGLE